MITVLLVSKAFWESFITTDYVHKIFLVVEFNWVFYGKNQFNLAKRLKAAHVHDSDTLSPFSQRLGGGVGSKSLNT